MKRISARRSTRTIRLLFFALALAGLTRAFAFPGTARAGGTIVYVRSTATGANDGTSWTNAYTSLVVALNNTTLGEIWVTFGTYMPDPVDASSTFILKNGVEVYGGFAGTETTRDQRDWQAHPTTLRGSYRAGGGTMAYVYHVVTANTVDSTAVLDGFTITLGQAGGFNGAGILATYASPTLRNLIIRDNTGAYHGGGISCENSGATFTLTNIMLVRNSANFGGGIYLFDCPYSFTNVIFQGNTASLSGGGMVTARSISGTATGTITNGIFVGNQATNYGGGYVMSGNGHVLTNVTFAANTCPSTSGCAIYSQPADSAVLWNNILWGNTDFSGNLSTLPPFSGTFSAYYTDFQGGFSGTGNRDADPQFVRAPSPGADATWGTSDDDYGDLRLKPGSPAIDQGNNSAVSGVTTDLAGNRRVIGTTVDMGAYESFKYLYLPLIKR